MTKGTPTSLFIALVSLIAGSAIVSCFDGRWDVFYDQAIIVTGTILAVAVTLSLRGGDARNPSSRP